jgi:hypothetical protein
MVIPMKLKFGWKNYTKSELDTAAFEPKSMTFWKIYSILMIPLNIAIMLYMFGVFWIDGLDLPIIRDWQRGLWLSQYIGLFLCYLCLTGFKNEDLNGMYAFVFLFPHIAFYSSGDPFSFLNHFPHFLGWFMLLNPKMKFSRRGIYWGFAFIQIWLILCFVLQYPNGMGANSNNISDEMFPIIMLGGIIWLGFVDFAWMKKQQRIMKIREIPDEEWLWEENIKKWFPRPIDHAIKPDLWVAPKNSIVVGLSIFWIIIIQTISEMILVSYINMFWISTSTLLLGGVALILRLNKPLINELTLYLYPFALFEIILRIVRLQSVGWAISSLIMLFILGVGLFMGIKHRSLSKFMGVDNIGIWLGFFIHGILILYAASIGYHQELMELDVNFASSVIPLFSILLGLGWLIILRKNKILKKFKPKT